jgi:hypothetical protein
MLQRLLAVTSGYLKFTFACMLAGTAVFFFAGLAVAEPRVFLLVMALLAVFASRRLFCRSHGNKELPIMEGLALLKRR